MKCGIYQIRNLVDGKVYIGSSCEIEKRWYQHRWTLSQGIHRSLYLQNAWNKYGPEAFVFEVLEECFAEDLLPCEQRHLDSRKPYDRKIGYNSAQVAESPGKGMKMPVESVKRGAEKRRGLHRTEETREKMRRAKLGTAQSVEHRKARSASMGGAPFFVYRLDGVFVGEFFSTYQAAKDLGVNRPSLNKALRGNYFQSGGYIFDYVRNGKHSVEEIQALVSGKKRAA